MAKAPKKTPGTDIVDWEAQMAEQAKMAAEAEKLTGGGKFFSTRAGVLSFNETALPGNQMAVVILDSIYETLYYEGAFDPDNRQGPTAFALGRDPDELVWNEEYSDPEYAGQLCKDSDICQWGSAETGRGKAAKEQRRLAVIPAGSYQSLGKGKGYDLELFDDEDLFAKADIAYLKVPVMSVKGFSRFVHSVAEEFKRPPHGVFARIWIEPDPKSQFRIEFEVLEEIPNELLPVIMKRHEQAKKEIDFPYVPFVAEEEAPKTPARKTGANSKLAKGRGKK